LLLFPNLWLWTKIPILIFFWILIICAVLEIRKYVCKPCGNIYCPLHQNK
jgi:hypothetical protein